MLNNALYAYRQFLHQYEQGILAEYDRINNAWTDVDYSYISHYLGDEYATNLRREEQLRLEQAKALYELQLKEALDFQRNELLQQLRLAQKDFLLGLNVEAADMDHLLEISRAFVYSYFDNAVNTMHNQN